MENIRFKGNTAGSVAFTTAIAAGFFVFFMPVFYPDGYVTPACLAALSALAVEMHRRNIIRGLVERGRSETGTSGLKAVYVNEVQVGDITLAEVIAIKLEALRDPLNYFAQFANVLNFVLRGIAVSAVVTPVLVFWVAVFSAWIAPGSCQPTVSALTHLRPGDLSKFATLLIVFSQITFVTTLGLSLFLGFNLGLENVFRRAVDRKIRRHVGCASAGPMTLATLGAE